jgi:hypothetical protein
MNKYIHALKYEKNKNKWGRCPVDRGEEVLEEGCLFG